MSNSKNVALVISRHEMLKLAKLQIELQQSSLGLSFAKSDFEEVSRLLRERTKYDPLKQLTMGEMVSLLNDYSLLLMDCDYLVNSNFKTVVDAVTVNKQASNGIEKALTGVQSADGPEI